jgi:hypothetical protein
MNERLTGERRYRIEKRLFRPPVLILQVKVFWQDGPPDHHGMPLYLSGREWRDATVEDLTTIEGDAQEIDRLRIERLDKRAAQMFPFDDEETRRRS